MKYSTWMKITVSAATMMVTGSAFATGTGVMNMTYDAPGRDRLVQALVTYPSAGGGRVEMNGDNAIFKGVKMQRDALPERKKHPLAILSHGSGGNAAGLAWLSNKLADEGYVVIAPNHQGSTSGDSTPETTIPATWLRKSDMTALLDAVAASPSLNEIVSMQDITAIGFSLGGQTVLGLAGARLDADAMAKMCNVSPKPPGCDWLDRGNALIKGHVDLRAIDKATFNAGYMEPRIKQVIAIDPAFVPAYDEQSLKEISVPVGLINLGSKWEIMSGVDATPIAGNTPGAQLDQVPGADHFSFLPECKWLGAILIWWEGDDPVCTEPSDTPRAKLHEVIWSKIAALLKRNRAQQTAQH
jgi:predicted dienelactone hydrolase